MRDTHSAGWNEIEPWVGVLGGPKGREAKGSDNGGELHNGM